MKYGTHVKTLAKTVSWRFFAGLDTFAVALFATHMAGGEAHVAVAAALGVVGMEAVTKMGWYYLHERAWEKLGKYFEAGGATTELAHV